MLSHPNNKKYKNLNVRRIGEKLNTSYINWLLNAGFHTSDDGKRLIFNVEKLDQLKDVYNTLQEIRGYVILFIFKNLT